MKIIILGGGISGVTLGKLLSDKRRDVLILEKDQQIGGLCKTKSKNGFIYDLFGGHVYNSKFKEINEFVFKMLPKKYWIKSKRICKIKYKNNLIDYPFELSVYQLPVEEAIDCVLDFLAEKKEGRPNNFNKWLKWTFGKSISEKYLIPYNKKIWKRDLNQLDFNWTFGKMPVINKREFIRAILKKSSAENKMPHHFYFYPKNGGIQTFINKLAENLNIKINYQVKSIKRLDDGWLINNELKADKIISTLPLPELSKACNFLPIELKDIILNLQYNPLTTVLFREKKSNLSWVYLPENNIVSHRLVYIGNFSPNNTPKGEGSVIAETTLKVDPEILMRDFDFKKEDIIDWSYTKYAYPIFDLNYERKIKIIREYFKKEVGITLLGRFAEWRYYNMDICIKRAMEVKKELLKDRC